MTKSKNTKKVKRKRASLVSCAQIRQCLSKRMTQRSVAQLYNCHIRTIKKSFKKYSEELGLEKWTDGYPKEEEFISDDEAADSEEPDEYRADIWSNHTMDSMSLDLVDDFSLDMGDEIEPSANWNCMSSSCNIFEPNNEWEQTEDPTNPVRFIEKWLHAFPETKYQGELFNLPGAWKSMEINYPLISQLRSFELIDLNCNLIASSSLSRWYFETIVGGEFNSLNMLNMKNSYHMVHSRYIEMLREYCTDLNDDEVNPPSSYFDENGAYQAELEYCLPLKTFNPVLQSLVEGIMRFQLRRFGNRYLVLSSIADSMDSPKLFGKTCELPDDFHSFDKSKKYSALRDILTNEFERIRSCK